MRRTSSYPCRQLNSERIKGATLCYLSPVIVGKCSVVSAKCFLSVENGLQKSWDEVCQNRDICDQALSGIKSVAFFFSAISAQRRKKHKKNDNTEKIDEDGDTDDELTETQVASRSSQQWISSHPTVVNKLLSPCIHYWVALATPNGAPANPLTIHRALLECGEEAIAHQVPCHEGKESIVMKELFKVLKDHSNTFMEDLVKSSYQYCFTSLVNIFLEDSSFAMNVDDCGTENVVRVYNVHPSFESALYEAIKKIQDVKLKIDLIGFDSAPQGMTLEISPEDREPGIGDKLTVLINDISIVMKRLDYGLYRGTIYKKCEKAKYTYVYKCDVGVFINSLAANDSFKARLLSNMKKVIDILSDPHCEVIRPIIVDHNLIEVDEGHCWSISARRFVRDAIPTKKIGSITPRAFSRYDPFKDPEPKYFREILENSLSETEIGVFCEDFLRLLNFNKKRHKEKVPCLVGDADSGKTSLFYPVLGLIHHSNIATITKQKVFNKAMINKFTEVIFIDEASPSMLDVDEWKILTQGGYTACDVKYQTAKSFLNRCPMLLTAQQRLEFKAEDQPAMDRRLRYYTFKNLENPKKKAAVWLRKHPMECVVWSAQKAHPAEEEIESSEEEEEDPDKENDDGTMAESEKEVLRTLPLIDLLASTSYEIPDEQDQSSNCNGQDSEESSDDDESITDLKRALEHSDPWSLRHRQIKHILKLRLEERQMLKNMGDKMHERRQQHLLSRGVTTQHIALVPKDPKDPLPTPITDDLHVFNERAVEEELESRQQRANQTFKDPWLRKEERELFECMTILHTTTDSEKRKSMLALKEILEDKLKNHHRILGTLHCNEALQERKRTLVSEGLLHKDHQHLVETIFQALSILQPDGQEEQKEEEEKREESSEDDEDVFLTPEEKEENEEQSLFITPVPSSQTKGTQHKSSISTGPKKRRSTTPRRSKGIKKVCNSILKYFLQQ